MLERNIFGKYLLVKKLIMSTVSLCFYPVFRWRNPLTIRGSGIIEALPDAGVLFVSNHQTYFTDVIAMHQVFSATKAGYLDTTRGLGYLLRPFHTLYYVAASETMASGIVPRILAYGSSISIRRTWREGDRQTERDLDLRGIEDIGRALGDGWVATFPQGTTRPFAPGRLGIGHLIRQFRPLVVPVVVDGFSAAFGRTGLDFRNPGQPVRVRFKEPLELDYDASPVELLAQIMDAIEQSEAHRADISHCPALHQQQEVLELSR